MLGYLARRILQFIPSILGATAICWALVWTLPGNPFAGRCGQSACSPDYIQAMTDKYGLNDPLPVQYLTFLRNIVTGNLGESFSGVSVSSQLAIAVPVSTKLALLAVVFQVVLAGVIGIIAGSHPNSKFDVVSMTLSLGVFSLPVFVVAFVLQYVLGVRLHLFAPTVLPSAPIDQLILPALVLALATMATLMTVLRASVADGLSADYLRTARAKGLMPVRIMMVHLLRNTIAPTLTVLGIEFATLLGGTVIVEGIFNINGVGGLIYRGIQDREQLTVATVVTLLVVFYLALNLLVDLVCAFLDPRSRDVES